MLERRDGGESRQGKGDALVHPVVLEFVLSDGLAADGNVYTRRAQFLHQLEVGVGRLQRGELRIGDVDVRDAGAQECAIALQRRKMNIERAILVCGTGVGNCRRRSTVPPPCSRWPASPPASGWVPDPSRWSVTSRVPRRSEAP